MFATDLTPSRRRQAGLSIIEIMVGMVVALLVSLAAAGSASVFTASQRQGIGAGGAAINGASALAALKNDAAGAGLGFFGDSKYLCNKLNLSLDAAVVVDGADFSPVLITTQGTSDRIDVVSSTEIAAGTNVLLNAATTGTSAELRSLLPVSTDQAVLLGPKDPGSPCMVRTVTAVTAATETTKQTLTFANTGKYNKAAFTTAVSYADKGRITLLGEVLWSRYRVSGTDLLLERPLLGGSATLVRNVMAFRAEYGVSAAAGQTTLDSWQPATATGFAPLSAANLPRVRALRIGLVTRSDQREKVDKQTGQCEASATKPVLFGASVEPDVTDWQCYRYRVATVVVPLRNFVSGVTP